jgi:hypothetical protein
MSARGRIAKPSGMNQLESAYAMHLAADRDIAWFAYEGVTLKLAHDTRYTPDFAVMLRDGTLEMRECKGPHAFEDSLVKLKCAAAVFPFVFRLVTRTKDGAWDSREVGAPRKNVPANNRDAAMTTPILGSEREPSSIPAQRTSRRVEAGANAAPYPNSWRPGDPIPEGFACLGSRLVARNEALEMIRK